MRQLGLYLNWGKTKLIQTDPAGRLKIGNSDIEQSNKFWEVLLSKMDRLFLIRQGLFSVTGTSFGKVMYGSKKYGFFGEHLYFFHCDVRISDIELVQISPPDASRLHVSNF